MRSLIHSAALKLTLWYLGIIMILSGFFSFELYQMSAGQLIQNADRQRAAIERLKLPVALEPRRTEFEQLLDDQVDAGLRRLKAQMLGLNLITLVLGGALAYLLARRTLRPIQDSLDAQSRFTADASHELRTPLTAMRSEIEVALRDRSLSIDSARELLGSNLEEIAKLEALSAGLLRLARSENGLDPAAVSQVPVKELFEAAIDRHQAGIAQRHLALDVKAGAETVQGDRASLIELVAILLDNAIKYSPAKTTISLRSASHDHSVHIQVSDQGSGINASDIPHIFDRFYRASRSRTKAKAAGGYGLGLSIAKRITALHHGHISVTSVPDSGSTFTIRLPAKFVPHKPLFG